MSNHHRYSLSPSLESELLSSPFSFVVEGEGVVVAAALSVAVSVAAAFAVVVA